MQRQFIHNLTTSFTLWFDHTLLQEGQAFTNVSGNLFKMNDKRMAGYQVYGSPYKQWVYDTSIQGANVPSGVYVNGAFKARGTSGLALDFQNGRAIFDGGPANAQVSGVYAVKDFNIYRTTRSDEELLFNTTYLMNPEMPVVVTGVPGDKVVGPAIFLKLTNFSNEAWTIGGTDETTAHFRAIIMSNTEYALDGVGQIFSDQRYNNFQLFPVTPLNEFNDVKSGNYSFNDYLNQYFDYGHMPYLADISYSRLLNAGGPTLNVGVEVGFLEFAVKLPRIT